MIGLQFSTDFLSLPLKSGITLNTFQNFRYSPLFTERLKDKANGFAEDVFTLDVEAVSQIVWPHCGIGFQLRNEIDHLVLVDFDAVDNTHRESLS